MAAPHFRMFIDGAFTEGIEHGRMVKKLAAAILAELEESARIVVAEQGKPPGQARSEINATAMFPEFAGGHACRIQRDILPSDLREEDMCISRVPCGVVAARKAWSCPPARAGRKPGPALTAGITVVRKGYEITPLFDLDIARIPHDVGFPAGVINVVTGAGHSVGAQDIRRPMQTARELSFGEPYVNRGCGEPVQGFHLDRQNSGPCDEDGQHGFDGYLGKKTMYLNWADA